MSTRFLRSILVVTVAIAAAVLGAPACGGLGVTGGSGGAATTSSGAGGFGGGDRDCDNKESTCGDATSGCIACAETFDCKNELNLCNHSLECQQYGQCIEKCAQGDDACVADCAEMFPYGSSRYQELLDCVICKHCPVKCDAPGSGCGV